MSELPKGWGKAYVSELVENSKSDIVDGPFGSNLKATEYIESGVPIARIQNVKRFIFNKTNRKFVSEEKYKQLIRHTYMGGDILLTKLGEPLGLACIVPHTEPNGVIVADLVRIRPNSEITNTKYLEYVLNSQEVIIQIASHVKGSTRARINLSVVRGLSVPLAPLAEQKRIVEKLDQVLAQVDTIKTRLDGIPAILKRFRQSVLAAAVSGKLTEEWRKGRTLSARHIEHNKKLPDLNLLSNFELNIPSWSLTRLGSITRLINGDRGKNYPNKAEYVEHGIPFINTGHIDPDGTLSLKRMNYITEDKFKSLGSGKVEPNDLVYCLRGATMGKTAKVDLKKGAVASSLVIVRASDSILRDFLYYFLISPTAKTLISKYDNGSAQPNLSAMSLASYPLYLPTIEEQAEIVRLVDQYFAFADTIEQQVQKAQQRVDKLTQSILAKAFRGELVPQDPSDDPADELLKRIAAARAESEALALSAKKTAKKIGKSK